LFSAAAEGFVAVVAAVGDDAWDRPALGEWSVRDLVGHTSRALSTVETYLADAPVEITLHDPLDYLRAALQGQVDHSLVAARGKAAGVALGDDPAAAVAELVARITALVDATADDAPVRLAVLDAGLTLRTYLPTRTLELTVHTLDLADAVGTSPPPILEGPIAACLTLVAAAAGARPDAAGVLLALTGRRGLPAGFSVV
jgi:uncharacterized protein (TIGR03083 family)